jgi:glycine/D-amino acid oxidase-like deaminating enzyme
VAVPQIDADRPRTIVVVGGGVFGLTAALALRQRGWRVLLIDPAPVPRALAASTDISKVVRPDYGPDEVYVDMAETAIAGWREWNARWAPLLYHQDGFLLLSGESMRPGGFEHESYSLLLRRKHPVERLDPRTRVERFPAWSPDRYPDGYFNPGAGWAESGKVLERLTADAQSAGITLLEGVPCARLMENGSRTVGVALADGRELDADVVLVAAGAWTPALLPDLGRVMWATGQPVVHFKVPHAADWSAPRFPVWAADIARTGWYGFPALADGTLKIGHHGPGRRVDPDEPRSVTASELDRFRTFLADSLPALAGAPVIGSRLCLYCDTFDGHFWIDHDPARAGLVVAAGDSGHAFKFAPILGALIADVVERRDNPWASTFRWRDRLRDSKEAARAIEDHRRA